MDELPALFVSYLMLFFGFNERGFKMSFLFQLLRYEEMFLWLYVLNAFVWNSLLIYEGEFVEVIFILSISLFMITISVPTHVIKERKYGDNDYVQEDNEVKRFGESLLPDRMKNNA